MASLTRTCVRCHHKKIRVSPPSPTIVLADTDALGSVPGTQSVAPAHVLMLNASRTGGRGERIARSKPNASRGTNTHVDEIRALKYYQERTRWLEEQLQQHFGISCAEIETGTSLRPSPYAERRHVGGQEDCPAGSDDLFLPPLDASLQGDPQVSASTDGAPEASLVALNAAGDLRYLGPSSGIFFALYANAFAQLSGLGHGVNSICTDTASAGDNGRDGFDDPPLCSETIRFLLRSYRIWIEPLYPVLDDETVDAVVSKGSSLLGTDSATSKRTLEEIVDLSMFYLVLALGAINQDSTVKLLRSENLQNPGVSSASLCRKALRYMNTGAHHCVPSIPFIQILLLFSIYSMHGPVSTNQWQLVGSAMRLAVELGLHTSSHNSRTTEAIQEERKRLFWTVYSVEISLAYNLGRPPSIGEEHITVELPTPSNTNSACILHFEHRRIQSRIVARIYGANRDNSSAVEAQAQIARLQQDLDEWQERISTLTEDAMVAYPYHFWLRLYHGTTFVLHRASPLCPNPTHESIQKCLQSAGAYASDILHVLQQSHVPLSWMLVQGVLFAGLTMLVTARTSLGQLHPQEDLTLVLVDLPAWTRQCSICLAIMNERWHEPLLSKLTAQFESLVNDTLTFLTTALTRPREPSMPWQPLPAGADLVLNDWSAQNDFSHADGTLNAGSHFELMRDVMGFDPDQNFWDSFSLFQDP